MTLPRELTNIFTHKQKSYKMVLILSLIDEMNATQEQVVSLQSVKDRFLAYLRDREINGLQVDDPPKGTQSWKNVSPSQFNLIITTPLKVLSHVLDINHKKQTIGFQSDLYAQWNETILKDLYEYAKQELEAYYQQSESNKFSLQRALGRIMSEYIKAKSEPLANHPLGSFVRQEVPRLIQTIPQSRLLLSRPPY